MISRQMENLERNCMIYKPDEKHISLGGINMNELYISDCWIYFKTDKNTYDEAMDEFLKACANADIDITIENACLRDENGVDVE